MITAALLAFAAIFLVVGIARAVEFKAAGLSAPQRRLLIPLHVLGCVLLSGALALLAIDVRQERKTLMSALFFGGVALLFPLHIYLAIKRKIRISDRG